MLQHRPKHQLMIHTSRRNNKSTPTVEIYNKSTPIVEIHNKSTPA